MLPEIDAVKMEAFVATKEMLESATNQKCSNAEEAEQTKNFLEILRSLYKDQMEQMKLIQKAGRILEDKLKAYKVGRELEKLDNESLDTL